VGRQGWHIYGLAMGSQTIALLAYGFGHEKPNHRPLAYWEMLTVDLFSITLLAFLM